MLNATSLLSSLTLIPQPYISFITCMLETLCWRLICVLISRVDVGDSFYYVGANIHILVTCFVTNIEKLSPTDFVSNIRRQHLCSRKNRIDYTGEYVFRSKDYFSLINAKDRIFYDEAVYFQVKTIYVWFQ